MFLLKRIALAAAMSCCSESAIAQVSAHAAPPSDAGAGPAASTAIDRDAAVSATAPAPRQPASPAP